MSSLRNAASSTSDDSEVSRQSNVVYRHVGLLVMLPSIPTKYIQYTEQYQAVNRKVRKVQMAFMVFKTCQVKIEKDFELNNTLEWLLF